MSIKTDLSICIVNWNGIEFVARCLDSIKKYSESLSVEIIVADNNSSDNSIEILENQYPEVKLIKNQDNRGFARANNQAIFKSSGKYILILNPDIILVENCLRKMIDILEENENTGCVSSRLVNPDGKFQENHFHYFPNSYNEFLGEGLFLEKFMNNGEKVSRNDTVTELKWATGACLLFKRDVLLKLRGFDEQFFMYSEDVDLCFRLQKLGYNLLGLNLIKMFHHHAATSDKKSNKQFSIIMQKESRFRYIKKHYGTINAYIYKFLWLLAGLIRTIIALIIYPLTLVKKEKKANLNRILFKHLKIISWSFSREKWIYPLYEF